jgi:exonuclease III
MTREGISLENVAMIPSCCAIAAKFREVWILNVYAPSGTARKQERERFFTSELPYLLTGASDHILLGGDFNCVLETADSTGYFNNSRQLAELVHELALADTWQGNQAQKVYTHYSVSEATRIDRIYTKGTWSRGKWA